MPPILQLIKHHLQQKGHTPTSAWSNYLRYTANHKQVVNFWYDPPYIITEHLITVTPNDTKHTNYKNHIHDTRDPNTTIQGIIDHTLEHLGKKETQET